MVDRYCVYKHTSPNGKVYIGITGMNPVKRWKNGKGYKSNVHFWRAICHYGWDSFTHEIIKSFVSKKEAAEAERVLIAKYHSNDPERGYNITAGGETNILPPSSLKKISEANKGRIFSDITKKKMSDSRKELLKVRPELCSTRKGYKMSDEHKKKLHEASLKSVKKPIECIETGERYVSLADACRKAGVNLSSLSEALHGRQKSAGGYTWRFVEVVM